MNPSPGGDTIIHPASAAMGIPPVPLFLGPLTPLVFLALVVVLIVLFVRGLKKVAGIVGIVLL